MQTFQVHVLLHMLGQSQRTPAAHKNGHCRMCIPRDQTRTQPVLHRRQIDKQPNKVPESLSIEQTNWLLVYVSTPASYSWQGSIIFRFVFAVCLHIQNDNVATCASCTCQMKQIDVQFATGSCDFLFQFELMSGLWWAWSTRSTPQPVLTSDTPACGDLIKQSEWNGCLSLGCCNVLD